MTKMGLQYGLEKSQACKRAFRWLFTIPGVAADNTPGVDALPPEKSARPSISFKEMEIKHLIEDVYYPCKPDWKPITITLFDLKKRVHPVWEWLVKLYDAKAGKFFSPNKPAQNGTSQQIGKFIKDCTLTMYNGCGNAVEKWYYEDAWPQSINFQTLDMGQSGIMTCEITLRYARAYYEEPPRGNNAPTNVGASLNTGNNIILQQINQLFNQPTPR
jgi:hypothetical protein